MGTRGATTLEDSPGHRGAIALAGPRVGPGVKRDVVPRATSAARCGCLCPDCACSRPPPSMVCPQPLSVFLRLKCLQHNVKRVRYSAEAIAAKKEREKARLKELQTLTGEVLPRVRSDRAGPSAQGLYTLHPPLRSRAGTTPGRPSTSPPICSRSIPSSTPSGTTAGTFLSMVSSPQGMRGCHMSLHRIVIRVYVCVARPLKSMTSYPTISP